MALRLPAQRRWRIQTWLVTLQQHPLPVLSEQLGITRINLMFDCDDAGTEGAKEALRFFAERQLDVRLVWSPSMHNSEFNGSQPESLSRSNVETLLTR